MKGVAYQWQGGFLLSERVALAGRRYIQDIMYTSQHGRVESKRKTNTEHEVLKVTPEIRGASSGMDTHLKKIFIYITKGSKFG